MAKIKQIADEKGLRYDADTRFFLHVGANLQNSRTYQLYNHIFGTLGEKNIVCIPYETNPGGLQEVVAFFRASSGVIGLTIGEPHKLAVKDLIKEEEVEEAK